MRFKRIDKFLPTTKLRNLERMERGELLGRMSALYGAPDPSDPGFSYALRDEDTNVEIEVYVGPSGPAFGVVHETTEARRSTEAFEEILRATPPVDSRLVIGGGRLEIGVKDGKPYERAIKRPRG